jgi:glycosyltransferase involved in cell wall biosynthesis
MLTQYLHTGGLERMVLSLCAELAAGGAWAPQAFAYDRFPDAAPDNDLRPAFAAAGIPTSFFLKPRGFSPRLVRALRRKIADENIGVLHTHDLGPLIYGAVAKRLSRGRVRLVHTQHSFVGLDERRRDARYLRFFARFADAAAVVSEDTKRSFVELGVPAEKIFTIPNGARFPAEAVVDKMGAKRGLLDALDPAGRAALAPFADARWILYMARLHRAKGQDRALALWGRLSRRARAQSVLLFVGPDSDPGSEQRLRSGIATAADAARVLYLGGTTFPERWLAAAELVLSCSEFEGMPLGPVEAAGAGLPLVLSRIPGHAFARDWSAQYPLDDPAEGARRVEEILDEIAAGPEDYFARAWSAAQAVRERYTVARMSADYARLYRA